MNNDFYAAKYGALKGAVHYMKMFDDVCTTSADSEWMLAKYRAFLSNCLLITDGTRDNDFINEGK